MDALLPQPTPRTIPPAPPASRAASSPAAVLGLESGESDPVRIIMAAQLRLRRYRRAGQSANSRLDASEMRRIVQARDQLLSQAVGKLKPLAERLRPGRDGP